MHRSRWIWILAAALASCSRAPAPEEPSAATTRAVAALPDESADVLRASLTTGDIPTDYAAQFEANQLTRIIEHRRVGAVTLEGEYEFKGARLLHYRGAKLADAAPLELRFDMQGALQGEPGTGVSEEDIRAVRDRAQLLRSHALARRASKMHH